MVGGAAYGTAKARLIRHRLKKLCNACATRSKTSPNHLGAGIEILAKQDQSGQGLPSRGSLYFLDADETHTIDLGKLRETSKRDRAGRVHLDVWIPSPADADRETM